MTASDTVGSLLERLSAFLRYGDRSEEEVQGWLEEIDEHAQPSDLPRLFAILDDDDTSGVLWDVLYIAESMDDDYLRALLDQLPALWARAPQWAITAVLRILNTAGDEEDCVAEFLALARTTPASHTALHEIAAQLEEDRDLVQDEQRAALRDLLAALHV